MPNEGPDSAEKQELIDAAKAQIWHNLETSGIARLVVEKSEHAVRIEEGIAYDHVGFSYEFGTMPGLIFATPRIGLDEKLKTVDGFCQPVALKLDRISRNLEHKRKLSASIWANISDESKMAIAEEAIKYFRQRGESNLIGCDERREVIGEDSYRRYKEQYENALKSISMIEKALIEGRLVVEVEPELASLKIYIKGTNFEK